MKLKNFILIVALLCSINLFAGEKYNTYKMQDSTNQEIIVTETDEGLKFSNSTNKVILLNFFGKKCPPCLMEIPHLVNLQKKYKKDFEIIALQVQAPMGSEKLNSFIKEKSINYTVVDGEQTHNLVQFVMSKTGWEGMIPFMVLFDKKGIPSKMYVGLKSEEEIEKDIKALL